MSQQTGSSIIRLTRPGAGQTVNVPIDADNMRLGLGFEPDPNAVEKNGQNLEFTFDDGGKLVLEGYYDHFAGKTLPVMVMESGDELPGEDFLASLREDLLTAAGPGAGAAAGGGGAGDYADDAGSLIGSIDRLSALGTDYWSRTTAAPEFALGDPEVPGGTVDVSVLTSLGGGAFALGMYEDWQPYQNTGDYSDMPGQLFFNFTPTGTTIVTNVSLSGFTAGTQIIIGDPANPDQIIDVAGPGETLNFTYEQLTVAGVYVKAPDNDDTDMTLTYTVDLEATGSGLTDTVGGSFTAIVDAVADLPAIEPVADLQAWADSFAGYVQAHTGTAAEASPEDDGTAKLTIGEVESVLLPVEASFEDVDGSESHYIKITGVPEGWVPDESSLGALGLAQVPAPAGWAGYDGALEPAADGTVTYIFQVVDQAVYDSGTLSGDIKFNTGDWTSERLDSGAANDYGNAKIGVSAIAWEGNTTDAEVTLDNNYAETDPVRYEIEIQEDKPVFIQQEAGILSDETPGVQPGTDEIDSLSDAARQEIEDILPQGEPVSIAQTTVEYNLFSDGANDPHPAEGGSQAAVKFELSEDYKADPQPCGWQTTDGQDIYLYEAEGGHIVGRIGGAEGPVAFLVTVTEAGLENGTNTADITFIQYQSLRHPDASEHDEPLGKDLGLTLAVYDDEGDRAEMAININVRDDAPTIDHSVTVNLSETDLPGGTDALHHQDNVLGNSGDESQISGHFNSESGSPFVFGADGPSAAKPFEWVAPEGKFETTNGTEIVWEVSPDGLTMTGYAGDSSDKVIIFTASDVTGEHPGYTVQQFAPIRHDAPGAPGDDDKAIDAHFLIRDNDGDTSRGDFTVNIHDDAPVIQHCSQDVTVKVSETDLPGGSDSCHIRDDVPGNLHNEAKFIGELVFKFGADGPADPAADHTAGVNPFTWNVDGLDGEYTSGGEPVRWEVSDDGLTATGYIVQGNENVPILVVTAVPNSCGARYTVDLKGPLDHDWGTKHESSEHGLVNKADADNLDVTLGFTITDGDGDASQGNLTVQVRDDMPCAGHCAIHDTVFETCLRPDLGGQIHASGQLHADFGADGPNADHPVVWDYNHIDISGLKIIVGNEAFDAELVPDQDSPGTKFEIWAKGANAGEPSMIVEIVEDGCGGYRYEYTQNHAIQHSNGLNLENVVKDLQFQYTVFDRDGDWANNTVDVTVVDSVLLPGFGGAIIDESWGKAPGGVIDTSLDLHLDYHSPDGISDPKWGDNPIDTTGLAASKDGASLKFSVEGNVLTLMTEDGTRDVLTLTLAKNGDGTWRIDYHQVEALDHPLGGFLPGLLGHNDLVVLNCSVEVSNAEGITVNNPVLITVVDDAPSIPWGTSTGMAESLTHFGDVLNIVDRLQHLDFSFDNLPHLPGQINAILSDIEALGTDVFVSALNGIDLVFGTEYAPLGELLSSPGDILGHLGEIKDALKNAVHAPENNHYAESAGHHYGGEVTVDFGYDGPHPDQPVVFSAKGVSLMLQLFGIHETGVEGGLTVVRDQSHLENTLGTGPDGKDEYDKLLVYSKNDGEPLMVLTTYLGADGQYHYDMVLNGPLAHNQGLIGQVLEHLLDASGIGSIGDAIDQALQGLIDLGLPLQSLLDFATMLNNVDLSRDTLLVFPLPVVAQDADGDKTLGLVSVAVRDSVPVIDADSANNLTVYEENLHLHLEDGSIIGSAVAQDDPVNTDVTTGSLFVNAFDGVSAVTVNGQTVAIGESYQSENGTLTITGITELDPNTHDGNNWQIHYQYQLDHNVEHEPGNGHNTDIKGGDERFTIGVIDGDGDHSSATATVTVTIVDDVPVAFNDTDSLNDYSADDGCWVATGNIVTGEGVETDHADVFGADGPGFITVTGNDGNATSVDETGETLIHGKYGNLYIQADGSYRYEVTDAHGISAATPPNVTSYDTHKVETPLADVDPKEAGNGLTFSAFNSLVYDAHSLSALELLTTLSPAQPVATPSGMGVHSLVNSGGEEIGHTPMVGREGLLIDLNNTADHSGQEGTQYMAEVGLAGLSGKETARVYFYDLDGKMVGDEVVVHAGDPTASYKGTTQIGHILVVAGDGTLLEGKSAFTVSNVEFSKTTASEIPDPDWTGPKETFEYTLTDSDGDESNHATLTIDLDKAVDHTPTLAWTTPFGEVYESMLFRGTEYEDNVFPTTTGTLEVTSYTDLTSLEIGGKPVDLSQWDQKQPFTDDTLAIDVPNGQVTGITVTHTPGTPAHYEVKLTYTLTDNSLDHGTHPKGGEGLDADHMPAFDIKAVCGESESQAIKGTIQVFDDAPALDPDNNTSATVTDGSNVAGHGHIGFMFGADGKADPKGGHTPGVEPFAWDAETLNVEHLYQTYDADGAKVDIYWKIVPNLQGMDFLKGYAGENGAEVISVATWLNDRDGGADYSVTLSGALVHPAPVGGVADTTPLDLQLPFIATDGDGDTVVGNAIVSVTDTVPEMTDLTAPVDGTGTFTVDGGADGINWSTFTVNGQYLDPDGSVTVDGATFAFGTTPEGGLDGTYTYTSDAAGTPEYTFAVEDRDGDLTSQSVKITTEVGKVIFDTNDSHHLEGGTGADLIVGDEGGTQYDPATPKDINLAIVVDTSGSMLDAAAQVKAALEELCTQVQEYNAAGAKVNLALIGMGDHSTCVTADLDRFTEEVNYVRFTNNKGVPLEIRVPDTTRYYDLDGNLLSKEPNPTFWEDDERYYSIDAQGQVTDITRIGHITGDDYNRVPVESTPVQHLEPTDYLSHLLDSLRPVYGNGTNYEAAFNEAKGWFEEIGVASHTANNEVIFITDGAPTLYYVDAFKVGEGAGRPAVELRIPDGYTIGDEVYWDVNGRRTDAKHATYKINADGELDGVSIRQTLYAFVDNPTGTEEDISERYFDIWTGFFEGNRWPILQGYGSDTSPVELNEGKQSFDALVAMGVTVHAVGFGEVTDDLNRYDSGGNADIIHDVSQLGDILKENWSEATHTVQAVGSDTIHGGAGSDIIFGDAVNADYLLADPSAAEWNADHHYSAGDGMHIVNAYLAHENQVGVADVTDTMRAEYILGHHAALGQSDSVMIDGVARGGDDVIFCGAGNDIIYGQGGNDTIHGGAGDDVIYGGKGNDTMSGGEGKDVFAWMADDLDGGRDTILDFKYETDHLRFDSLLPDKGDLDISDLLTQDRLEAVATENGLTLTVYDAQGGHEAQGVEHSVTVEIHFDGNMPYADADAFNGMTADEQAAILHTMIITNSGG